ncbi:MAG TPA: hypothetical protein VMS08_00220, partial [Candidatus Saccharimonadia bacterium]|nr:hypothetical protein [Candidatus Saccharimonadia bacterium]
MIISSEQLTAIGTVLMALLPVLGLIYSNSRKMGVLEFKVETMWQAQLRRGMAEAIAQNHGTLNSPFTADPAASALFGPLLSEMKNFINTRIKAPIRDSDILMLLEHEFGERVTQTVCIPNGMNQLGCMLVALSLIREGPVEIEAGQTFITEAIIT